MKPAYLVVTGLIAVLVSGAAYTGYHAWNAEPAMASGPLVLALKESRASGERRNNLNAIYDEFIDNTLAIDQRVPLLEAEGFVCTISASNLLPENRILSCQRPLEGTRFCEGFLYYVYEAATGEILDRSGTDYYVHENDRDLGGRCLANEQRYDRTDRDATS